MQPRSPVNVYIAMFPVEQIVQAEQQVPPLNLEMTMGTLYDALIHLSPVREAELLHGYERYKAALATILHQNSKIPMRNPSAKQG
jgi:hypothetical protein